MSHHPSCWAGRSLFSNCVCGFGGGPLSAGAFQQQCLSQQYQLQQLQEHHRFQEHPHQPLQIGEWLELTSEQAACGEAFDLGREYQQLRDMLTESQKGYAGALRERDQLASVDTAAVEGEREAIAQGLEGDASYFPRGELTRTVLEVAARWIRSRSKGASR